MDTWDKRLPTPMTTSPEIAHETLVTEQARAEVLRALDKVLASKLFQSTERLSSFLRYIVEQWVKGNGDELKEYSIALAVFGREQDFDSRLDPIVRVEAGRLRLRLKRYYATVGAEDPLQLDLPKGGYLPSVNGPVTETRDSGGDASSESDAAVAGILLPAFTDLSPSHDQAYLCHGLREELVHALTKVPVLRVYAQSSVSASQSDDALRELAKTLGAEYVLTGSVRRVESRVRVCAQLVKVSIGAYSWSETFERESTDVLRLQEEIARAIVSALRVNFPETGAAQIRHETASPKAYNLYMKGRYFWNLRTEQALWKGVNFFQQSVSVDDHYALAYTGLADSYTLLANYGATPPNEVRGQAREAALRAIAIAPKLVEAHTSLAHVLATYAWDWDAAEAAYERAIGMDAGYATAHHWYAITLLGPLGRLEEAIFEMQRAHRLDPVSLSINRDLAILHLFRRRFDLALEQSEHTIALDPCFPGGFWILGQAYQQLGDHDRAVDAFQHALELDAHYPRFLGALGHGYAQQGRVEEARQVLARMEELMRVRYVNPFESALIHIGLDDFDTAFECLEQGYQIRCYELVSLQMDPRFDPLRSDRRYRSLLDRVGLRSFAER